MGSHRTISEIKEALEKSNGLVSIAADILGCTPQAIYSRMKTTPSIRETIDNERNSLVDQAELALRNCVLKQEPWAVALVVRTLGKDRGYTERQEVTGADGSAIKHEVIGYEIVKPEDVE